MIVVSVNFFYMSGNFTSACSVKTEACMGQSHAIYKQNYPKRNYEKK